MFTDFTMFTYSLSAAMIFSIIPIIVLLFALRIIVKASKRTVRAIRK